MANEFIVRKGLKAIDNIKLVDTSDNNIVEIYEDGTNATILFNNNDSTNAIEIQRNGTNPPKLRVGGGTAGNTEAIFYTFGDVGASGQQTDGGQMFVSPSAGYATSGQNLGSYEFRAFGTSGTRARISGVATQNHSGTTKGTELQFYVTKAGNNPPTEILNLNYSTGIEQISQTQQANYTFNSYTGGGISGTGLLSTILFKGSTYNIEGGKIEVERTEAWTSSGQKGADMVFYTPAINGSQIEETLRLNLSSSQFRSTGSYGSPSLIVGDPTLVGGIGGNALGFWVSESSDSIYHSNIAVHSVGEGWQDILSFTRDEGTTIGGVTSNFQFPNLITIGSIDKGVTLKATGSTGDAEDLFFNSAGGSGQMKLLIGTRNADNDRYKIELKDNGTGSFEGDLDVGNTGSFAHLKATVIEGNSPLTLRGVSSLTFDTNPGEITFNNTDLRGNPVFHGDVNVYSGSAFLDQVDAVIFRSTNTTIPVDGFLQLGDSSTPTELRGSNITLTSALTASAISASGDITITINGGTF